MAAILGAGCCRYETHDICTMSMLSYKLVFVCVEEPPALCASIDVFDTIVVWSTAHVLNCAPRSRYDRNVCIKVECKGSLCRIFSAKLNEFKSRKSVVRHCWNKILQINKRTNQFSSWEVCVCFCVGACVHLFCMQEKEIGRKRLFAIWICYTTFGDCIGWANSSIIRPFHRCW